MTPIAWILFGCVWVLFGSVVTLTYIANAQRKKLAAKEKRIKALTAQLKGRGASKGGIPPSLKNHLMSKIADIKLPVTAKAQDWPEDEEFKYDN